MKFTKINVYITVFLTVSSLFIGCEEDELAFDVVASPVLAVFEDIDPGSANEVAVMATFYELDKSGILDKNIGIDSTRIANLPVEIFTNELRSLGSFTTNAEGEIMFEIPFSDVAGASRLEWVGTYNDIDFRIYKNL